MKRQRNEGNRPINHYKKWLNDPMAVIPESTVRRKLLNRRQLQVSDNCLMISYNYIVIMDVYILLL